MDRQADEEESKENAQTKPPGGGKSPNSDHGWDQKENRTSDAEVSPSWRDDASVVGVQYSRVTACFADSRMTSKQSVCPTQLIKSVPTPLEVSAFAGVGYDLLLALVIEECDPNVRPPVMVSALPAVGFEY